MSKIRELQFDKSVIDSVLVKSIRERNSSSRQIQDQFQEDEEFYHSLGPE